MTGK
jgi:hypothetical protein